MFQNDSINVARSSLEAGYYACSRTPGAIRIRNHGIKFTLCFLSCVMRSRFVFMQQVSTAHRDQTAPACARSWKILS